MPEKDAIYALPEISIDDVCVGDLLFFARQGPLQNLFWAVEDVWLHTALAVERNGVVCTGEAGAGPQVFSRPLQTAVEGCDLTAIGRTNLPAECVAAAANWAGEQIGDPQSYAWDDFLLAALAALTRKGLPSGMLGDLGSVMQTIVEKQPDDVRDRSRTCASFVHEAFGRYGAACALSIKMTDTNRFGLFESATTYSGLLEMSTKQQDELLANLALYEFLSAEADQEEVMEGIGDSRVTSDHVGNALALAFQVAKAYLSRPDGAQAGELPGRWASPTDLWRSDRITYKARLARPK